MKNSDNLLEVHPQEFVEFLNQANIRQFYFVFDRAQKKIIASHPELQPIADFILTDKRDFLEHEGLFFRVTEKYDTLLGAFVHRTVRGQAAGGVRFWQYDNLESYLRDGLRLAKGMTRKNALAGIWWGGGKGVISHNPSLDKNDPEIRAYLYRQYGEFLTALRGCYVTAEDAGTNVTDMHNVFSQTRFTTCIPAGVGGSGNPSVPTASGIVCGMEAALDFLNLGNLEGKTIAIQGLGNVGQPLVKFLFEKKVKKIVAADIYPELVDKTSAQFSEYNFEAYLVDRSDASILFTECDIVSPCATGAILNKTTIPKIQAKIICGAANNQLEDAARDDDLLHERGIVYVPDFLTNRMGIVTCADEQFGYVTSDPFIEQHLTRDWEFSIYQTTLRVLNESGKTGVPPARVAMRLADELSMQPHPIFGHRGQQIIDSLMNELFSE